MKNNDHILNALSVPKRREIVELVASKGQLSATDISNEFKITSAAISQHLKVLREATVLKMEKKAQLRLYTLNPDALDSIEKWAREVKAQSEKSFNQTDKVLANAPP